MGVAVRGSGTCKLRRQIVGVDAENFDMQDFVLLKYIRRVRISMVRVRSLFARIIKREQIAKGAGYWFLGGRPFCVERKGWLPRRRWSGFRKERIIGLSHPWFFVLSRRSHSIVRRYAGPGKVRPLSLCKQAV